MHRSLLFLLFLFPAMCCWAQGWSRFRGPNGAGVLSAKIPATWSESENLVWKSRLTGKGSSSPVLYGDKIFLTAYSGYAVSEDDPGDRGNLRLHVLCVSLSDGKILWDRSIAAAKEEQNAGKRVMNHGYASPTPCVDDQRVYAFFGPSGMVCYSHAGELLWKRGLGTQTAGFGAAASPMLFQDLVIMNASIEDGAVYGLDKATGKVRWRTDAITRAWTTPSLVTLASGKQELVLNQKGAVLGLEPTTGSRLWNCYAIQDYVVPGVLSDGERLFCSGGRSNMTFSIRAGGRGDVSETHLVWDVPLGANVTSPILVDGYLYWSHDKAIALCLRASDGQQMFRERLPTRSRVYASIVSDGEKLFLTTRDRGVLVLEASPTYTELSVNQLGDPAERFNATPALTKNRLLLRSDTTLYCIGEVNGGR